MYNVYRILSASLYTGALKSFQPRWRWTEMKPMNLVPTNTGQVELGGLANICRENFAQWPKFQVNRFFILDIHPKFTLYGYY